MTRSTFVRPLFAALLASPLLAPAAAQACGGFFFDATRILPVEQNTERMLFEVGDDGTITALLEIRYSGAAEDFSWVVPVPGVPAMEVAPQETLALLDAVTRPSIVPPPTRCSTPAPAASRGGGDLGPEGQSAVDVLASEQVGPYDATVISSDDAGALMAWLDAEGYLVTPEMEPAIAGYVASGANFVAVRLSPDSEVSDIAPLAMTFEAAGPSIPIVIAGVAAEPEMGIVAWFAGEDRFGPAGWDEIQLAAEDVQADPRTGASNYHPLLSWRIDEAGGHAVVPEYVGPSVDVRDQVDEAFSWDSQYDEARAYLAGVAERRGRITRLYSRVSAWEMDSDPGFLPVDSGDFSGVYDLSDRPAVEVCANPDRPGAPCGDLYCGVGAQCATTDIGDGCVCPEGETARMIDAPNALLVTTEPTVACQRLDHDMTGSLSELGLGFDRDPCDGVTCGGSGQCVEVGGFATCRCDAGFAAVSSGGVLVCSEAKKVYGPEALLWNSGCACDAGADGRGAAAGLALLLGPLLVPAARRRR